MDETTVAAWGAARNVLAVRMDNMGDIVMLGPALRAVKARAPDSRLTLLASPAGTQVAPLLPWVDDVITWRAVWQDVGGRVPFAPHRERELVHLLAERHFDAVLIFTSFSQNPHVPAYVCYLAGIPLRAGDSKEFGGGTLSVEIRDTPDVLHQVERNLRLVEAVGIPVSDRQLGIGIPIIARRTAAAKLASVGIGTDQPFILLHPGASASARRYPAERFGAVAASLLEQGWPIVITGVGREQELLATVQRRAPAAHTLADELSLPEYAAIIDRAALVLCNNTLPMHLADAVRTPAVVLFAGTEYEEQWRPRATQARLLRRPTPCQPCYRFTCPIGLPCLDIPPDEVAETVLALLATVANPLAKGAYSCVV